MGAILIIPNADFSKNAIGGSSVLLDRDSLEDNFDISCAGADTYAACDINAPKNVSITKIKIYISSKVKESSFFLVKGVKGSSIEDVKKYQVTAEDISNGYVIVSLSEPIKLTDNNGFVGVRPSEISGTTYVYRAKEDSSINEFSFIKSNGSAGTYLWKKYTPKITYYRSVE